MFLQTSRDRSINAACFWFLLSSLWFSLIAICSPHSPTIRHTPAYSSGLSIQIFKMRWICGYDYVFLTVIRIRGKACTINVTLTSLVEIVHAWLLWQLVDSPVLLSRRSMMSIPSYTWSKEWWCQVGLREKLFFHVCFEVFIQFHLQKLAQSHTSLVFGKLIFMFTSLKAKHSWCALVLNLSLTQKALAALGEPTLSVVSVIILTLKQLVEFQWKYTAGIQIQHAARSVSSSGL